MLKALKSRIERLILRVSGVPFDLLSMPLKRSLILAQDEAERFEPFEIGTGPLLLGLMREPRGLACAVVAGFGLRAATVRDLISETSKQASATPTGEPMPTNRTKKAIQKAFDEMKRLGKHQVGTEHLLLGILLEGGGTGARALLRSGVTLKAARARVQKLYVQGLTDALGPTGWADLELGKLSAKAERALIAAAQRATELGVRRYGGAHVLLGILAETGSRGARILEALGVSEATVEPHLGRANWTTAAEMSYSLTIELGRLFLTTPGARSIDSADLIAAVLEAGGQGGGILASLAITKEKLDQAVAALPADQSSEEALGRYSPALESLLTRRAIDRLWIRRYTEARADFSTRLSNATTPTTQALAASGLAWADLLTGDRSLYGEALTLAQQAHVALPDSRGIRSTLALAFIENGRNREGLEILKVDGPEAHDAQSAAELAAILALATWRNGDKSRARKLVQRVVRLDPECSLLPRIRAEIETSPT